MTDDLLPRPTDTAFEAPTRVAEINKQVNAILNAIVLFMRRTEVALRRYKRQQQRQQRQLKLHRLARSLFISFPFVHLLLVVSRRMSSNKSA